MAKIISIDIGRTTIKADVHTEKGVSLNDYKEVDSYIDYDKKSNTILKKYVVWLMTILKNTTLMA
ncbi:hypothetical protein EB41_00787 [Enterococcus faecalis]|nr:hypothetical protein EB41_00787 [Enterococcus faecalis]